MRIVYARVCQPLDWAGGQAAATRVARVAQGWRSRAKPRAIQIIGLGAGLIYPRGGCETRVDVWAATAY